ncbi:hypothetical protein ACMWQW_31115 [Escherichia coli]
METTVLALFGWFVAGSGLVVWGVRMAVPQAESVEAATVRVPA